MTGLAYNSTYIRAPQYGDEDSVSMLSEPTSPEQSQRLPPGATDRRKSSSEDGMSQRVPSWLEPPTQPQESNLYNQRQVNSPIPNMGFSVFGDRTRSISPYQEQVAWANSTHFTSTPAEPKPQMVQTTFLATATEAPPASRKYFRHPRHMLEPWTSGVWARFPWWGFGNLFLVVLLTGGSAGILLASHGTTMEDWKIGHDNAQPYVYISVLEMMMNFLILLALARGVVIRFWRQLLRGTTLDSIHDSYESAHPWHAIKRVARLRFNMVAVACILACVSFARGPIFHRALTINENDFKKTGGMMDLNIAPYPRIEFLRSNDTNPLGQTGVTPMFTDLVRGLVAGNPLTYGQHASCGDYCTGFVKGYAFEVDCQSAIQKIDLNDILQECKTCTTEQCRSDCQLRKQTTLQSTFFATSYGRTNNSLMLKSVHKNATSCSDDIQVQTCTLTQIIADVPFVITNGTIDRRFDVPTTQGYYDSLPNDDLLTSTYWPLALNSLFPSVSINVSASSDFNSLDYTKCLHPENANSAVANSTSPTCSSSSSDTFAFPNDPSITYAADYVPSPQEDPLCGVAWNDPMPDMLNAMQSLAFRTTVAMATAPPSDLSISLTDETLATLRKTWTQRIPITGHRTRPVYYTSPLLLALGVIISLIGVIAIVPLYWGFWELGRQVSLNPLEIARAFGAPLMEGLDGNTTPGMICVERGGMGVKYGALDRYGEEKRLRVEESGRATVRTPWQGEIFG